MPEQSETERLATQVFRAWTEAQIEFVVVDGYAEQKEGATEAGRERGAEGSRFRAGKHCPIAVFVAEAALARAEVVMRRAAAQAGFRLHNRTKLHRDEFYFSSERGDAQVCIVLARDANCKGFGPMRRLGQILRPAGLSVVLCGPDGSGKSMVAQGLMEQLSPTFSSEKGRHFHWKPPLFSAGRQARRAPVQQPHAQAPRSAIASLLFFGAHWVEFFLGWYLRIWPVTSRGGLVLIDRYYYDFFVDPLRYRLRLPNWLARLGYAFLRKPDLVLVLDAPPEVLQQRKSEVPLEETRRQREAFRELAASLPNARIIDASQPAQKVVADARQAVLEFLAARLRKREGRTAESAAGETQKTGSYVSTR